MRYALSVLGLAAASTMLLPTSTYAGTSCDPAWSTGFEWVSPPPYTMGKSVEFDDGSGPAIFTTALGTSGRVMKFQNGTWKQVGTPFYGNPSGVAGGQVHDIIIYNGELYVCGQFRRVGTTGVTGTNGSPSTNVNGVAKWSPTTGTEGSWVSAAASGIAAGAAVVALEIQDFGDGPKLYAAGNLNNGLSLGVYNGGTAWTVFSNSYTSTSLSQYPRDLAAYTDSMGNKLLIMGGAFGSVNATPSTFRIAAYNGTAWQSFTSGVLEVVSRIEVSPGADNNVFMYGGMIPPVPPSTVPTWGTMRWDGTSLHVMSNLSAITSPQIFVSTDDVNGTALYFNSRFDDGNGGFYTGMSRWTGSSAVEVVPGAAVIGSGLVGFDSDAAGPEPRRLVTDGRKQLVDGEWVDALGSPDSLSLSSGFTAMGTYDPDGSGPLREVLVGASGAPPINRAGVNLGNVARYDGESVQQFETGISSLALNDPNPDHNNSVVVNCVQSFDGDLYIAGSFTDVNGAAVGNIVRWDGSAWVGLAGGVLNTLDDQYYRHGVKALVADETAGVLYVGGNFTQVGGSIAADYVARWDGASWSALGSGLPGPVTGMTLHDDGTGTKLYAACIPRTDAGTDPTQAGVFKWNGAAWDRIGSSDFSLVSASIITADTKMASFNGELYIGGRFTDVDSVTYNNVARWDGTNWNTLSNGIPLVPLNSEYISDLRVGTDGTGTALFIAGRFPTVDGATVNSIVKWDGTAFSALGGGVAQRAINATTTTLGAIRAIAFYDDGRGTGLFGSGQFTNEGPLDRRMGNFGRFGVNTPRIVQHPLGVDAAQPGDTVVLSIELDPSIAGDVQWQRNGVNLVNNATYAGVDTETLTISNIAAAQAGSYTAVVTGDCGDTLSNAAVVSINVPSCPADFNGVNGVTVQDIFDFLTAWLGGSPSANFNGVNGVTVQDIFDFLTAWLAGC